MPFSIPRCSPNAATDGITPERRALSLVMGGGVIAGVVGPMLVSGTMHL
ncbi:hypothetical protein AHR05_005088 [Salmonella enterica subsp. salamae]|nr:hypothetical protein [Salmonella enterica subsp. enterica]EDX4491680.1 hypothetical protein [Salmonella enterica subsp. salamae]